MTPLEILLLDIACLIVVGMICFRTTRIYRKSKSKGMLIKVCAWYYLFGIRFGCIVCDIYSLRELKDWFIAFAIVNTIALYISYIILEKVLDDTLRIKK